MVLDLSSSCDQLNNTEVAGDYWVSRHPRYRRTDLRQLWQRSLYAIVLALLIVAIVPVATSAVEAQSGQLTVDVSGLRNYKGRVVLFLWLKSDETAKFPDPSKVQHRDENSNDLPCDFTNASVCRRTVESLQNLTVSYTFNSVLPGKYAVFAFHDENGNGMLDTGFLGRPLEGRGYSQLLPDEVNPIASKVSFERAGFTLSDSKRIAIGLRYPPRL